MESNQNKKNVGVIVYIIISLIVIITLSLLLIFLKKCNKDNFSSYCTLDNTPCNTSLTPGYFSCKCPGTYNGLNVLRSLQDRRGAGCTSNFGCGQNLDCDSSTSPSSCQVENCAKDRSNKIIFEQDSLKCDQSKLNKGMSNNACLATEQELNDNNCGCLRQPPNAEDYSLYFSGTV
jgi:hypothetical protein